MDHPQIIFIKYSEALSDYICRCPACGATGPLMEQFSWLAAGFNGIRRGDPDDVDLQECGSCEARLAWELPREKNPGDAMPELLASVLDYLWMDEERDYQAATAGQQENHIYPTLVRLRRWLKDRT